MILILSAILGFSLGWIARSVIDQKSDRRAMTLFVGLVLAALIVPMVLR